MAKGAKGGGFNTGQYGGFDPFVSMPVGPIGGRTGGGKVKQPFGDFSNIRRMPSPSASLQQQYSGLNQGVQGFQPLGIRGYTPPEFSMPMQSFNPFGYGSFGGNPFLRQPQLRSIPFNPSPVQSQPVFESLPYFPDMEVAGGLFNDFTDRLERYNREAEDFDIPIQRQEPLYQTQVVEGGADIRTPIMPPPLPVIPTPDLTPNVQMAANSFIPRGQERIEMNPNINIGKAGGGRVQGFAVGGMPEQNQTGERLEEETIMALMGKHPNPKEVFSRYLEVYGEEGLMALAAEVEQMMASQGRMIDGPGGGVDDFVPAMIDGIQPAALSKDEYVIPADVVAHAGDGSSEAGGKQFDRLVSRVRESKTGNTTQPEQIEFEEEIQQIT